MGRYVYVKQGYRHFFVVRYSRHKKTAKDDILQIFIQEHLDQPLKSEKLPFLLTET